MKIMLTIIIFALLLIPAVSFAAVSQNVWELDKIEIGSYSDILPLKEHKIENLFLENKGKQRTNHKLVIFADGKPDGYVHFVEWQTKEPVNVKSLAIFANCDVPNTVRKLKECKVYGKKNLDDEWTLMYDYLPAKGVLTFENPTEFLVKTDNVSQTGDFTYFRAEVIQNGDESPESGPIFYGIRGYESFVNNKTTLANQDKYATFLLHNQGRSSIEGIHKFVDGAKARGIYDKAKLTIILNGDEANYADEEKAFFKQLYLDGHEIGCEYSAKKQVVADWLGIDPKEITTIASQLFGDIDMEEETRQNENGFTASAHACVEGNSLAEFWDIPHNWEGAPMFPYYVQWDEKDPLNTARVNRELDKDKGVLELQWGSRTLWHNYDRFPIPQCWHLGEPSKPGQWRVGQLVKSGEYGGWWNAELAEFEKNFEAGRTPYLYLSVTIEACWFTDMIRPSVDPDECMNNGLDLIELFLRKGWKVETCRDFAKWYSSKWPCPESPSMVYLMEDTLANRVDRDGKVMIGNGHLLHAETKHFQITDSDNRIAPEMVVAYDCKSPNLVRGGYTFANPKKFPSKETETGHYASTTGNAIFWSPSKPFTDILGNEYFQSYKVEDCKNRTFTFYFGDNWEPYQFAKGEFSRVRRISDDEVTWTKEMLNPVPGTDIRVKYIHTLKGNKHIITMETSGKDAVGKDAKFRVSPYFHQGWDLVPMEDLNDPFVPDWRIAGQERNVFASVNNTEFAFSESNPELVAKTISAKSGKDGIALKMFNRNPGIGVTCDDNTAFNRGFTLNIKEKNADITFIDLPKNNEFVTAEINFGKHKEGQTYTVEFEYWKESDL